MRGIPKQTEPIMVLEMRFNNCMLIEKLTIINIVVQQNYLFKLCLMSSNEIVNSLL